MQNNKAQVTYFFILGFVVFLAGLLIWYIYSIKSSNVDTETGKISENPSIPEIKLFFDNCFKDKIKESIRFAALSGGYFTKPNLGINISIYKVPYYNVNGQINYPSKDDVSRELSKYIESLVPSCLNRVNIFKMQGFNFEFNNPKVNSIVNPNNVFVQIKYPIKVTNQQNSIFQLEDFGFDYKTRFGTLYEASKQIVDDQVSHSNDLCLSCISKISEAKNLTADIYRVDNSYVFEIIDNASAMQEEPLIFMFANKYGKFSCKNLPLDNLDFINKCAELEIEKKNYSFYLNDIPKQNAKIGSKFYYKVESKGFNISFSDFTNLFDINKKSGIIEFIPNSQDAGNHSIWILAMDGLGNVVYKNFELEVS